MKSVECGEMPLCKLADKCRMSMVFGGFPMCYDPFGMIGHPCSDYEAIE